MSAKQKSQELAQLKEMFPAFESEVVLLIHASTDSFDSAISTLLAMASEADLTTPVNLDSTSPAAARGAGESASIEPAAPGRDFPAAAAGMRPAAAALQALPNGQLQPTAKPASGTPTNLGAPLAKPPPYRPPSMVALLEPQAGGGKSSCPQQSPRPSVVNGPSPLQRPPALEPAPAPTHPASPRRPGSRQWWPPWEPLQHRPRSAAVGHQPPPVVRKEAPPRPTTVSTPPGFGHLSRSATPPPLPPAAPPVRPAASGPAAAARPPSGECDELDVFVRCAGGARRAGAVRVPADSYLAAVRAALEAALGPALPPAFAIVYCGQPAERQHEPFLHINGLNGTVTLDPRPVPADEAAAEAGAEAAAVSAAAAVLDELEARGERVSLPLVPRSPSASPLSSPPTSSPPTSSPPTESRSRSTSPPALDSPREGEPREGGPPPDYSTWGDEALVMELWREELWQAEARTAVRAGGTSSAFLGDEEDAVLESKYDAMRRTKKGRTRHERRRAGGGPDGPAGRFLADILPGAGRAAVAAALAAHGDDMEAALASLLAAAALAGPAFEPEPAFVLVPASGHASPLEPAAKRSGSPLGPAPAASCRLPPPAPAPRPSSPAAAQPAAGPGGRGGRDLLWAMKAADLADSFPTADAADVEAALAATDGDKAAAADVLQHVFPTRREVEAAAGGPAPARVAGAGPRPAREDWRREFNLPSLNRRLLPSAVIHSSDQPAWRQLYRSERAEADRHKEMHRILAQSAARAFAHGLAGLAAELSRRARQHGEEAEGLHGVAAEELFAARNAGLDNLEEVDLHGLHCAEAVRKLAAHPYLRPAPPPDAPPPPGRHLRIVAGAGNHSEGARPRLRPEVEAFLRGRGLQFTEPEPGVFRVRLPAARS